jgi:hypothetical protein
MGESAPGETGERNRRPDVKEVHFCVRFRSPISHCVGAFAFPARVRDIGDGGEQATRVKSDAGMI